MTSFFPDLNVWVALSVGGHRHNAEAWNWLNLLPREARLIFSRYTHVGLLRLLTNQSAMGEQTLTLRRAWSVYDRWLSDPRVEFYPEPRGLETGFREATAPFAGKAASKWVGDCYLLAYARQSHATLVTFDKALFDLARSSRL
ncbi:MAG: hypothetical protein Q8N47_00530 [Bryobacterales bacterium]|nr:hypothetical protein [Bryobacterales bacterium]